MVQARSVVSSYYGDYLFCLTPILSSSDLLNEGHCSLKGCVGLAWCSSMGVGKYGGFKVALKPQINSCC